MTTPSAITPLTIGHLARDLVSRAGQPMPVLRCYESLAALWVRSCDTGLPGAGAMRDMTLRAGRRLAAGEDTLIAPEVDRIPSRLTKDASVVRLPASLAVQGVEWPDAIALAEAWLRDRQGAVPVLVAGVRTGGAYLAPLVAARLEAAGVDVRVTSVRPGETPDVAGRRVLLVDDPPLTGRTLLALARHVPGPAGGEVLVPVFDAGDVQGLLREGIAVTVLPRERWQSTRRLQPDALSAYLDTHAHWQGPAWAVDGLVPGRENSALVPWPGVRRRSAARAAVRLRTPAGLRHAVAGWVPPGIFGDAARAAATVRSPVVPATLAVTPALVVSEHLTPAAPLDRRPPPERLQEAIDYVLARAGQLPVQPGGPAGAMPTVLQNVARALAGTDDTVAVPAAARLLQLLSALAPALPDHRCEAEKWLIDGAGRLRKTGHLAHPYRRDNELLTPLLDLAALSVAFGSPLDTVADRLARRIPGGRSWYAALAVALLCYGTARGAQLPRTYNPQRAAETAVEAYRLQTGMAQAAEAVQRVLADLFGPQTAVPRVVHRWQEPPGALVQPRLPFGGTAARPSGPAPTAEETQMALKAVARWAEGRIQPVQEDGVLLLAPLQAPAGWPRDRAALEELARMLPRPELLAWCGVPIVVLGEVS
ncbi:phosphoribosyltransferase family protein [Streptomyces sp. NPDC006984]|uniref:phosphoribosyltransferase family protein n=1 Tax=Streptomyces sp. NPDC006984 TaxID=3155463 RepID=UPI0033F0A73D